MKKLLDKSALAEACCISTDTIDVWVKKGWLPEGKLMGGKWMWRNADVDAAIDVAFGARPSEAAIADRVFHATRKQVNGR